MKLRDAFACGMIAVVFGVFISAAEGSDPTGEWKWSDARDRKIVANLKLANGRLTGTVTLTGKEKTEIEDASFKDGEVAFTVKRRRMFSTSVTKYKGKLNRDTITGTSELTNGAEDATSSDWEAEREKS